MEQKPLNDKLIAAIIEKANASDKRDKINKYISEVAKKCVELCKRGESLRVLNEYRLLIDTLRNEFGL